MGALKDSGAESHRLRGTDPYPRKVQGSGKKGSSHRQLPQRTSGIMASSKHHCIPQTTPKPRRARSSHTKPVRRSPRGKVTTTGISSTEIEAEDICSGLGARFNTLKQIVGSSDESAKPAYIRRPETSAKDSFYFPTLAPQNDHSRPSNRRWKQHNPFRSGSTMRNSGFKGKCNKCGKIRTQSGDLRTTRTEH